MKWCDRDLWQCRYSYGLCLSEKDFEKELKRMNIPAHQWPSWVGENADATTHFFDHPSGAKAAIVCMSHKQKYSGVVTAALLVHEAVHIWQGHKAIVGEHKPGDESEAYAIQSIAQRLMQAYAERKAK